jgi:hypothetical protein
VAPKPEHRLASIFEMVLAGAVTILVSNTVLAHDIYSKLRDRDGHLCCGGQDCKPVEATVLPDGNYYLPASGETIPAEWQHHRLMSVSTNASIIQWQMSMILSGENQRGKTNPRLDASLPQ